MSVRNIDASREESAKATGGGRLTQADRSARTRSALLESAARGLSRYGFAGEAPYDELLAARAVAGVLGLVYGPAGSGFQDASSPATARR